MVKFPCMKIPDVIRLKQEQHVHNEKEVLSEVNHSFLIRLFWTHHDERFLYMLMDYVPGGELFSYLRSRGRFSNATGLFYTSEIVCAREVWSGGVNPPTGEQHHRSH
uniref:Protein kinase domain-containing protein n=1 Tax=Astatotilapia calliptera TaxID=8154 RepID=A0AAX7VID4_ASTCA